MVKQLFRNTTNTRSAFLAVAYFAQPRYKRASVVKVGNDIIYKKDLLQDFYSLLNSRDPTEDYGLPKDINLHKYRKNISDQQKFMEDLAKGYHEGEAEIIRLINTKIIIEPTQEKLEQQTEKPVPEKKSELKPHLEERSMLTGEKVPEPSPVAKEAQAPGETPTPVAPTIPLPEKVETPGFVKDILSRSQIFIKRFTSRYLSPTQIASLFTGLIGAIAGATSASSFGVAGPVGALVGGGAGLVTPVLVETFFKSGGGEKILNMSSGGLHATEGLLTNFSRLENFTGKLSVLSKGWLIPLIIIGMSVFFLMGAGGLPTPNTPTTQAPGNLASCQFTRSGVSLSVKSPSLLSIFQEVSVKSGVPFAALASLAMHESQDFTANALDDHDAFSDLNPVSDTGCKYFLSTKLSGLKYIKIGSSSTGALGLMQVQPPKSIHDQIAAISGIPSFDSVGAYSADGVEIGAQMIGKTADSLTLQDFCDVRTSVYLGAGVLTSKNGGKPPITPAEVNQSVCRYYGNCQYGYFNYGLEAQKDFENCQVSNVAPIASADRNTLRDDILKKFGINFDKGFSYNYLYWAWGKLWNTSSTRFLDLVRGPNKNIINVLRNTEAINEQYSCTSVGIRAVSSTTGQPYPEALFKYVFLHELSHIIDSCYPGSSNKNGLQTVINQEGYLTNFSQNSATCPGSKGDIPLNEDYADTISYFLNPEIPEQNLGIGSACEPASSTNPYSRNKTLHQKFAQDLLGTYSPSTFTTQASTTQDTASCPVDGNPKLWIPSFQKDNINGHCGSAYNLQLTNPADKCEGNTRRGKSMDILTEGPNGQGPNGKDVKLPLINNQTLNWTYLNVLNLKEEDCFEEELLSYGCGKMMVFKADVGGGKNWVVHLVHMFGTDLKVGETFPSGEVVGKSAPIHVHVTVGKDIKDPTTLDQKDPGWIPADVGMKMCI